MIRSILVALVAALLIAGPSEAKSPSNVYAAGDSIVAGVGAPAGASWPDWMRTKSGFTTNVWNVGHGGQCLVVTYCGYGPTLLQTFDAEVLSQRPDTAIVAIGRNDLCHTSTAEFIDALLRLRGRARNVGTTLYFGTITPVSAAWPWPCEAQRVEINNRIRQMPNVIDFERLVISPSGYLLWKYDSGDGAHLNSSGYQVMGQAAWDAVR